MKDSNIIVLSGLLQSKRLNSSFQSEGNWKVFDPEYQVLAKVLFDWFNANKELMTKSVLNDKFGGQLNSIWDKVENHANSNKISGADWKWHLSKLKETYSKNLLSDVLNKASSTNDIHKYISEANSKLNQVKDLFKEKEFTQKSITDGFEDYFSRKSNKDANPDWNEGILTGYSFLDVPLAGLRKGELLAVGGPTGGGKSTFLMNIALQMWHQNNKLTDDINVVYKGYNILYFSLEMPFQDMWDRCLARMSMVDQKRIRDFKTTADDNVKIRKVKLNMAKLDANFEIIDMPRGLTAAQLETIIEDTKVRFVPDVVVVDYMGLMATDDSSDEGDWLKQGMIAAQLHEIARAQNVIMLTAVQLNRESKSAKEEQTLSLDRISRSATIAHNCNFVCLINQRKEENARPDFEIFLAKNRRGEQTKGTLYKYLNCCALLEYPNHQLNDDISEFIEQ